MISGGVLVCSTCVAGPDATKGMVAMSIYPERPPTPRELDEIAKAKRPRPGTFLVVVGCVGLVVILAVVIWSLAT